MRTDRSPPTDSWLGETVVRLEEPSGNSGDQFTRFQVGGGLVPQNSSWLKRQRHRHTEDFRRLSRDIIPRLTQTIERLKVDPFPHQVEKLSGAERLYRVRVGDYRIVYEVDTHLKQITIQHVRHRREVYRTL